MGFGNSQMHFLRFIKTKENYKENLSKEIVLFSDDKPVAFLAGV